MVKWHILIYQDAYGWREIEVLAPFIRVYWLHYCVIIHLYLYVSTEKRNLADQDLDYQADQTCINYFSNQDFL